MENELFCGTESILECFPKSTHTHILYNVEKIRRTKERKITIFFFWKVKWTFCWLIQKKYRTDKRHQTAACGSKHQPWLSCTANLSPFKHDFDYDLDYVISMAIPCFLLVSPHTLSLSPTPQPHKHSNVFPSFLPCLFVCLCLFDCFYSLFFILFFKETQLQNTRSSPFSFFLFLCRLTYTNNRTDS